MTKSEEMVFLDDTDIAIQEKGEMVQIVQQKGELADFVHDFMEKARNVLFLDDFSRKVGLTLHSIPGAC